MCSAGRRQDWLGVSVVPLPEILTGLQEKVAPRYSPVMRVFRISGSCYLVNNSVEAIIDKREIVKGSSGGMGSACFLRNESIKN